MVRHRRADPAHPDDWTPAMTKLIVGVAVGAITTFIAVWLWVVMTWLRM
jgi:hypothetical protein